MEPRGFLPTCLKMLLSNPISDWNPHQFYSHLHSAHWGGFMNQHENPFQCHFPQNFYVNHTKPVATPAPRHSSINGPLGFLRLSFVSCPSANFQRALPTFHFTAHVLCINLWGRTLCESAFREIGLVCKPFHTTLRLASNERFSGHQ